MSTAKPTGSPQALPSYVRPPVSEVAVAVYFHPPLDFDVTHVGALREKVRDRLPQFEQHPPLPPTQPEILSRASGAPTFNVTVNMGAATPRCWFVSDDRSWVLQVQSDRIVVNWRKTAESPDYPRFPAIQKVFDQEMATFLALLSERGVATPSRYVAEVTYINTIETNDQWKTHAEFPRVFTMSPRPPGDDELHLDDATVAARFTFPDREGQPTGRLYMQIQPVVTAPRGEAAYNLTLVARGGESPSLDDVHDFLEAGRAVIVTTFDNMTTSAMHQEWGRS